MILFSNHILWRTFFTKYLVVVTDLTTLDKKYAIINYHTFILCQTTSMVEIILYSDNYIGWTYIV